MADMDPTTRDLDTLLQKILNFYVEAVEYWIVRCLNQRTLGDSAGFIDGRWTLLHAHVQQLREQCHNAPTAFPDVVQEQVGKLLEATMHLRGLFDLLMSSQVLTNKTLEEISIQFRQIFSQVNLLLQFFAVLHPHVRQLPKISANQEATIDQIFNQLFDSLVAWNLHRR
ncbi:MAG: hypothetical protein R3B84_00395 [Zavarzinella sp.]